MSCHQWSHLRDLWVQTLMELTSKAPYKVSRLFMRLQNHVSHRLVDYIRTYLVLLPCVSAMKYLNSNLDDFAVACREVFEL